MVDYYTSIQQKSLEQATNTVEIHRAQGAVMALKKLKQLRDEINGSR
jgi:hypothetical protein